MASKSEKPKKNQLTFIQKVKKFFLGIYSELKLVVWPNAKTYKQALGTVFLLCIIAGVMIFLVDTFMHAVLNAVSFNDPKPKTHVVVPSETATTSVSVTDPSVTNNATESTTVEATTEAVSATTDNQVTETETETETTVVIPETTVSAATK